MDTDIGSLISTLAELKAQKRSTENDLKLIEKEIDTVSESLQALCQHELIQYRNFDGHRTTCTYQCNICNVYIDDYQNYPVIKTYYS